MCMNSSMQYFFSHKYITSIPVKCKVSTCHINIFTEIKGLQVGKISKLSVKNSCKIGILNRELYSTDTN